VDEVIDLIDLKSYPPHTFHDNFEVRLDRRKISAIFKNYPDFATAPREQLTKMTILSKTTRRPRPEGLGSSPYF